MLPMLPAALHFHHAASMSHRFSRNWSRSMFGCWRRPLRCTKKYLCVGEWLAKFEVHWFYSNTNKVVPKKGKPPTSRVQADWLNIREEIEGFSFRSTFSRNSNVVSTPAA